MRTALIALALAGCSVEASTISAPLVRQKVAGPVGGNSWRADHCGMCGVIRKGDGYRAFVTGSAPGTHHFRIGWIDLDSRFRVIAESSGPIVEPDPQFEGCFSVFMPCIVDMGNGTLRMHYVGAVTPVSKNNLNHRPFMATSTDGGTTWKRHGAPLLYPEPGETGIGTHHVWRDKNEWRMIYTCVVRPHPERRYLLKFATSPDGIRWAKPANNVALEIADETCARPFVWKVGSRYLMTYTHDRPGQWYRIRYADSADGWHFTDRGELLTVDPQSDWQSEMVCYGWPMPDLGLMFYSGNGFGAKGFGVTPFKIPE